MFGSIFSYDVVEAFVHLGFKGMEDFCEAFRCCELFESVDELIVKLRIVDFGMIV